MAPDQRYCIACGERRTGGGLRDALPRTAAPAAAAAPPPRRTSWIHTPSGSLIAGVATLLLALGVGVLIGRSSEKTAPASASRQPVVVRLSGGGTAGTSTAANTAAAATTAAAASKAVKHHKAKAAATKPAKIQGASSVQQTAAQNHVKLPPPVVKVGQKCAQGAKGCQGGKFTGNFFGGG
jgi:hypothetical protein